jgi:ribosomal protein S12 methylthiotransferase accessory factor
LGDVEAWIRSQQRQLWFLNLTHDLGIPVVAAISCDKNSRDLSFGFAAGWTISEATQGAIGELVQFEVSKIFSPRSDNILAWCSEACIHDYRFLRASTTAKTEPTIPSPHGMLTLISALWRRDLEVIVLNLSKKNAPFCVVRVLSPGLRHIWPRFAPGRLYDTSFDLSWQNHPLLENELNPIPFIY